MPPSLEMLLSETNSANCQHLFMVQMKNPGRVVIYSTSTTINIYVQNGNYSK